MGLQLPVPPSGIGERLDEAMTEWADMQYFEGQPASMGDLGWAALGDVWH